MPDPFRAQKLDRIPDTLRPTRFAGVNRDPPAGVAPFLEMIDKKWRREIRFVPGEIEGHEMFPLR